MRLPDAMARLVADRERRAWMLVALALIAAAVARVGSVSWDAPFRNHPDELGFVMWVAAHAEWNGFVHGSFEPTVTTYGPLVYELALATKWAISDASAASDAAHTVADGWAYLNVLDDPARTPLTMNEWIHAMRLVSAWLGVLTVLVLARATRRLAGPEAAALVAWLAALAPGLVQVSHYYTPDGLLLLFEVLLLDAASLLLDRPSAARASYAGLAIGLVLATKMTGALAALLVPWTIYARAEHGPDATGPGALLRACFARPTWIAVLVSIATYAVLCPWAVLRGPDYFTSGGGPTSGSFMIRTLYETHFGFYDWRFAYQDHPRGVSYVTWLLPYVLGAPVVLAGLAGLFTNERRTRLVAWGLFAPTLAFVSGWTVITIRYALPLAPPLLLSAAAWLAHLATTPRAVPVSSLRMLRLPVLRDAGLRSVGLALLTLVLAASLTRGLAWSLMFAEDDPRTRASQWIASHAVDGDVVAAEADYPYTAPLGSTSETTGPVPYPMPRLLVRRLFAGAELGGDVPPHLRRTLSSARYLVVSGWFASRARSHIAGLVAPEQARFYRALFAGQTGFTEVARFERTPRLGPLVWDESDEEQLAVCLDHCPVWIFERRGDYVSPFPSPSSE
ncbi:MAG: glycosyltransferase family 39 protein [Sandaracinaceae bacterium]|nr:glycosyltransferase family 39 protein [Sandaracinaceae bacterium]